VCCVCLSVVCYFVRYVHFYVLCLIVVPLTPGKNPFAVQLNNYNEILSFSGHNVLETGDLIEIFVPTRLHGVITKKDLV
jgi:hypothetical protein